MFKVHIDPLRASGPVTLTHCAPGLGLASPLICSILTVSSQNICFEVLCSLLDNSIFFLIPKFAYFHIVPRCLVPLPQPFPTPLILVIVQAPEELLAGFFFSLNHPA